MVAAGLARTGYDEVSLTSLSTADFSDIESVVGGVLADREATALGCPTTVNLPSLRVDAFTVGLAGQVNSGRRSGLTFAPEAGSWRLRSVINKLITEDDLYGAVEAAYAAGWTRMKLYFMIGLPTETDEDTIGIAELAGNCVSIGRRYTGRASVTASVGGFVPKPHTPFQWFGQNTLERAAPQDRSAARPQAAPRPAQVARPGGERRRGHRQPGRPAHRTGHRAGVAGRRDVPGMGRVLRPRPLDRRDGGRGTRPRLVRVPPSHRWRGPAVGPPERRAAQGLPVGRLAGSARRQRGRGLPVDALLRLRGVHRVRHRARRGVDGRRRPAGARAPARASPTSCTSVAREVAIR